MKENRMSNFSEKRSAWCRICIMLTFVVERGRNAILMVAMAMTVLAGLCFGSLLAGGSLTAYADETIIYASPTGISDTTAENAGTREKPYDLVTAFAQVPSGGTVCMIPDGENKTFTVTQQISVKKSMTLDGENVKVVRTSEATGDYVFDFDGDTNVYKLKGTWSVESEKRGIHAYAKLIMDGDDISITAHCGHGMQLQRQSSQNLSFVMNKGKLTIVSDCDNQEHNHFGISASTSSMELNGGELNISCNGLALIPCEETWGTMYINGGLLTAENNWHGLVTPERTSYKVLIKKDSNLSMFGPDDKAYSMTEYADDPNYNRVTLRGVYRLYTKDLGTMAASYTDAQGNKTLYQTLPMALDAATNDTSGGGTVQLLTSYTTNISINLIGNYTIDLNQYTISFSGYANLYTDRNTNLTLKNGKIELTSDHDENGKFFQSYGDLTIDNVEMAIPMQIGNSLVIKDGVFHCPISNLYNDSGYKLVIEDGKFLSSVTSEKRWANDSCLRGGYFSDISSYANDYFFRQLFPEDYIFEVNTADNKDQYPYCVMRRPDTAEVTDAQGVKTVYNSVPRAFEAAPDGATIKLLTDTSSDEKIETGKKITLDLNSKSLGFGQTPHNVEHAGKAAIEISGNGHLNLINSSSDTATMKSDARLFVLYANGAEALTIGRNTASDGKIVFESGRECIYVQWAKVLFNKGICELKPGSGQAAISLYQQADDSRTKVEFADHVKITTPEGASIKDKKLVDANGNQLTGAITVATYTDPASDPDPTPTPSAGEVTLLPGTGVKSVSADTALLGAQMRTAVPGIKDDDALTLKVEYKSQSGETSGLRDASKKLGIVMEENFELGMKVFANDSTTAAGTIYGRLDTPITITLPVPQKLQGQKVWILHDTMLGQEHFGPFTGEDAEFALNWLGSCCWATGDLVEKNPSGDGGDDGQKGPDDSQGGDSGEHQIQVSDFKDIEPGKYYEVPLEWAVKNGVTTGTSASSFAPNVPCTRGQAITMLYRALKGSAEPSTHFKDVPAGKFYARPVAWALKKGITVGVSADSFGPAQTCTRAQIMTFLWRALGCPTVSGDSGFSDVPSDVFYTQPVVWAVSKGVTAGTGEGKFSPAQLCTRAQIITFLYRALSGE